MLVKIKMLVQRQEADEKGKVVTYQRGKTYEVDKHFAQRYVDAGYASWAGGDNVVKSGLSSKTLYKRGKRG